MPLAWWRHSHAQPGRRDRESHFPPVDEFFADLWAIRPWSDPLKCQAASKEVPGLPCEDTIYDQMSHCPSLGDSGVCVAQIMPHKPVCCSAVIKASQPNIELDLARLPTSSSYASRKRRSCHGRAPCSIQYQRTFNVLTELNCLISY
jgi:hypothetical protein